MATFPSPSDIFTRYKTVLKSVKPSLNTNDNNSDFIIRGKPISGLVSGLYGDQSKVNDDTFILKARHQALIDRGADLGIPIQPATQAESQQVRFTGTPSVVIPASQSMVYLPTGILYILVSPVTIGGGGFVDGIVQCVSFGQIGNIAAPDTLQLISQPGGIDPVATLILNMADGSDLESDASYKQRLLDRFQKPPAGGNQFDYPNFAFKASPAVRSVFIVRFGRGLGTVDVYVTTGTTDIDTAVTQGLPIVRIPNPATIAIIQTYYDQNAPLTDCPKVFAPVETGIDVTVNVDLAQGLTFSSVPSDATWNPLGLTVQQLIEREVGRVLYKYATGGRKLPGFTGGYVVASDIEEGLDKYLSAVADPSNNNLPIGFLPLLQDRQVQKLDSPNYNKLLVANQLPAPGTITVILGT